MALVKQHPKINLRKTTEKPINYSSVGVDKNGDFTSLLEQRIVSGYGNIWGSKNDYGDMFVKGAWAKSISDMGPASNSPYKIKFRDRHGKSVSLFAELTENDIGLFFKTVPLDEVQWADDLLTQIKSGTINNFSVGFKYLWDRVEYDTENDALIVLEARLFEISAVDIPSDTETYACRSAEEVSDVENFIISLPKDKQLEARHIIARCMTPNSNTPPKQAPENVAPLKTGLDLNYLISKL